MMRHSAIPKERWAEVQRRLDRLMAAEVAAAAGAAPEMPGRSPSDPEAADRLFRRLIHA